LDFFLASLSAFRWAASSIFSIAVSKYPTGKDVISEGDLPPKPQMPVAVHMQGHVEPDPNDLTGSVHVAMCERYDAPKEGVSIRLGVTQPYTVPDALSRLFDAKHCLKVRGPYRAPEVSIGTPGFSVMPARGSGEDRIDFRIEKR
jgi:hypothetical protein